MIIRFIFKQQQNILWCTTVLTEILYSPHHIMENSNQIKPAEYNMLHLQGIKPVNKSVTTMWVNSGRSLKSSDVCTFLSFRNSIHQWFDTQTSAMMMFKNLVGRSGFLKSRTMSIGAICIGLGVMHDHGAPQSWVSAHASPGDNIRIMECRYVQTFCLFRFCCLPFWDFYLWMIETTNKIQKETKHNSHNPVNKIWIKWNISLHVKDSQNACIKECLCLRVSVKLSMKNWKYSMVKWYCLFVWIYVTLRVIQNETAKDNTQISKLSLFLWLKSDDNFMKIRRIPWK